jgi:hypothetical protein
MTKPEQIAASVRQRLKNLTGNSDFQITLVLYALERLLYRLSQSNYQQQFVLKTTELSLMEVAERIQEFIMPVSVVVNSGELFVEKWNCKQRCWQV